MKSFSILKKIDNLIFRLQLSSMMKIYSIVFITQLKSIVSEENFYDKIANIESLLIEKKNNNSASHYKIERLLNKKISREKSQYLIKWVDYKSTYNIWYSLNVLNDAAKLIAEYKERITSTKPVVKKQLPTPRSRDRSRDKKRSRGKPSKARANGARTD